MTMLSDKWIPTSERLPRASQRVLLLHKCGPEDTVATRISTGNYDSSGRCFTDGDNMIPEYVTYWMPLPELPVNWIAVAESPKEG